MFVTAVASNIALLEYQLGQMNTVDVCTLTSKIGYYDIACWKDDRIYAVGEIKSFWNLEAMPDNVDAIIELYSHSRDHGYEDTIGAHIKWLLSCMTTW